MLFAASRVQQRNEQAGLRRTQGTEYPLFVTGLTASPLALMDTIHDGPPTRSLFLISVLVE